MIYISLVASWAFFGLTHSLTATNWAKQKLRKFLGRFYRLTYNAVSLLTFLPVLVVHHLAPVDHLWIPGTLEISIGVTLGVVGLGITIIALRSYDLREFVGWPTPEGDQSGILQQQGLLQYVRHPLYSGILLLLMSLVIGQPTWANLISLLCATLYIRIGIHFEEQKLINNFGNSYRQYRTRTPMLIPHLFKSR